MHPIGADMGSTTDVVSGLQLPPRIQTYLDAVIQACTQAGHSLVSVLLFGSVAKGGFSSISDVDLIIVVPDDARRESKRQVREMVARLETVHGFRPTARHSAAQARVERAVGHLFSCFVCTRSDLLSGDGSDACRPSRGCICALPWTIGFRALTDPP
jgi:predicted nucleotidyltransferase